jgi:hypothetical protein
MYTGQQYVDAVRLSLDDPNDQTWSDAVLLEFVNDARETIWKKARWNFKKTVDATLDSAIGTADYTKPSTIRAVLGVSIVLGSNTYYLRPLTLDNYLARIKSGAQTGIPTGFFRKGNTLTLDPKPNAVGTNNISVWGYGKITRLALTDTEANLNEDFYLAIKLGAIAMAWDADEDGTNADPYWRRFIDEIKTLKRDYVPEQTGRQVEAEPNDYVDELDPSRLGTIT